MGHPFNFDDTFNLVVYSKRLYVNLFKFLSLRKRFHSFK